MAPSRSRGMLFAYGWWFLILRLVSTALLKVRLPFPIRPSARSESCDSGYNHECTNSIEKSGRIPGPGSGKAHVTRLPYVMTHVSLPEPFLLSQIYPNCPPPLAPTVYCSYEVIPHRLLCLIIFYIFYYTYRINSIGLYLL